MFKPSICIITAFPPQQKGEAEYAKKYVDELVKNSQFSVCVLTQKTSKANRNSLANKGVDIIYGFDAENIIDRHLSFIKLLALIVKRRFNLVHLIYGPNTDYGGRIGEPLLLFFLGLKLIRIPIIVTLHSVWLPNDVENRVLELGYSKLFAKLIVVYFTLFTKIFTNLVNKVLLLTTVENSPITRSYVNAYKLPPRKVGEELHGCQYNPINDEQAKVYKREIGYEGKKIILSFGLIRKDKGLEYLLEAFSKIPANNNLLLLIVGTSKSREDREYFDSLVKLSRLLNISDRVVFDSRYVSEEEMEKYVGAADIIVFPYIRNVGASGSLHYAISRGKPIIATNVGHMSVMKDIIIIVPPRDSLSLANAITRLLNDKEFTERIKAKELEYAKSHEWSRVVRLNLKLYEELIYKNQN